MSDSINVLHDRNAAKGQESTDTEQKIHIEAPVVFRKTTSRPVAINPLPPSGTDPEYAPPNILISPASPRSKIQTPGPSAPEDGAYIELNLSTSSTRSLPLNPLLPPSLQGSGSKSNLSAHGGVYNKITARGSSQESASGERKTM